jgi:hypothetical protein
MTPTPQATASDCEILLVGPYGVLGTGVIDAVAANPRGTECPSQTHRLGRRS